MTIINIRGTSGSGKSTLVHRLIADAMDEVPIRRQLGDWKKPKTVAYALTAPEYDRTTYVIGRYETQCGGCDAMSYKGSHVDIENLIREFLPQGNVVYEGLTISSTLSRWQRISDENPGKFIWVFMATPEEECHRRILARNGGKEPKHQANGLADYQIKFRNCAGQATRLIEKGEKVVMLQSENEDYQTLLGLLE